MPDKLELQQLSANQGGSNAFRNSSLFAVSELPLFLATVMSTGKLPMLTLLLVFFSDPL